MWGRFWREYLGYPKKERRGIFVLLTMLMFVAFYNIIDKQLWSTDLVLPTITVSPFDDAYKGATAIAGEKNKKAKDQSMRLGFLDEKEVSRASELIQTLIRKAMPTLNVFTISNKQKKVVETKEKMVFYEFDKNDIVDSTISNYIQKNKIDLMCVKWNDPDQSLTKKIIIKSKVGQ